MKTTYCKSCGAGYRLTNGPCGSCGATFDTKTPEWTQARFKRGDWVDTEYGPGMIIGIDLPTSKTAWRWIVAIPKPTKPCWLAQHGRPLALWDVDIAPGKTKGESND